MHALHGSDRPSVSPLMGPPPSQAPIQLLSIDIHRYAIDAFSLGKRGGQTRGRHFQPDENVPPPTLQTTSDPRNATAPCKSWQITVFFTIISVCLSLPDTEASITPVIICMLDLCSSQGENMNENKSA